MNSKHRLFALEYLVDLNKTRAAVRAGYSMKTAYSQGQRLLKNVEVKAFVDEQLKARELRTKVTADRVIGELYRLAMCDPIGAFNEDGSLKPLSEMDEDVRRCIAGIEVAEIWEYEEQEGKARSVKVQVGELKKIKLINKERPLENLAKHLKLLTERLEISGIKLEDLLSEANKPK